MAYKRIKSGGFTFEYKYAQILCHLFDSYVYKKSDKLAKLLPKTVLSGFIKAQFSRFSIWGTSEFVNGGVYSIESHSYLTGIATAQLH